LILYLKIQISIITFGLKPLRFKKF